MGKRDPYEVLGVNRNSDEKEIKQAYYRLAKEHHPDKNPDRKEEATEKFKEIQEAYEILKDPQRKARYDQFGWDGIQGTGFNTGGFGFGSFEDIVEEIFGSNSIFDDLFGTRTRRRSGPRPGNDLRYDIEVTLEDVVNGKETIIEVPTLKVCDSCRGSGARSGTSGTTCTMCGGKGQISQRAGFFVTSQTCPRCRGEGIIITDPCNECNGQGRVPHTQKLSITIPQGSTDGLVLRLDGRGEAGVKGGPSGDLHIVIHVREHPVFQRHGDDLICETSIAFTQAALGAEIDIPVIGGTDKFSIPPGTQSGTVFSIRDKGVPHLRGRRGSGDLLVKVDVQIPEKLSDKEEDLIRELAKIRGEKVTPQGKGLFEKVRNAFS